MGTRIVAIAILLAACNLDGLQAGGYDPNADEDAPAESDGSSPAEDSPPDESTAPSDETPPNDPPADVPPGGLDPSMRLFDTGLCVDAACTAIQAGVVEYKPRWALWTDGAAKRRWIALPPGTTIDDTDMDYWRFPVGTKLWKEFVRDGVRVETRYMTKTGAGDEDWQFMAFAWNSSQQDAFAAPDGVDNANGTAHDIPSVSVCTGCHDNVKSRVLGFGAFQLDYAAPAGQMDLDDAVAAGWITQAPGTASPRLPLPGGVTEQAALGYLHANCGHCHNSDSPLINRPMLRLEAGHIDTLAGTRTYTSTMNVAADVPFGGATMNIKPGDPDHSVILMRMIAADEAKQMPALGSELVDAEGQTLLRAWITGIAP